ncbi:MAG: SMP-30/gluconolactonase/LRE family protein [Candidatus Cloacimonetes bacterium]|jgi:sugar lactone lactonase YvrE|nr:SMP-30/gluconolactonase/LRE family protein [Candidatus Cloacimonadota bacterium]MDD2506531.1 SMP-30/gluconolactonase/LRE family protein [Candidatus Cloacimonadota bacterium]MDD4147775.1 SMP-30/gluconolactonase/LRE family protein [Candidatus Cloacimonadota bacterium]MDD4559402.1 SMP-30/gluconolactonase/LRE family protein [Candidatus Cloacimonadota bacterium]
MKKKYIILIIVILAIVAALIYVLAGGKDNYLNKPESVAYDSVGERFLISNVGDGSIVAMDNQGQYSEFIKEGFEAPKGLLLVGDLLYVTDPAQIHVVSVSEAKIIESYPINDAVGLNDIAMDEYGKLYITDTPGNSVFVYDPQSKTQQRISHELISAPNGIIYDRPRWQMFIVGNKEQSPILSLDTRDMSVSIFKDTMYSNLDGIAIDDLGRIYFSSWKEQMIIEIPQEQNRFITDLKGYDSAADIYYHLPSNELIVPMLKQNKIERITLN